MTNDTQNQADVLPQQSQMFLHRTKGRIARGEFDEHFNKVVFTQAKQMLFDIITKYLMNAYINKSQLVMTDVEILECVKELLEYSVEMERVFVSKGLFEIKDGYLQPTRKLDVALKVLNIDTKDDKNKIIRD